MNGLRNSAVIIVTAIALAACGDSVDDPPDLPEPDGETLWNHLQDENYQETWQRWPGTEELYEGTEPHGMLLTTYLNDIALEAVLNGADVLPDGAIIVKENYMPDSTFADVTTMYKVDGFDPEHNDWFWLKNDPQGVIDVEGRVADCQACHQAAAENDYIFTPVE